MISPVCIGQFFAMLFGVIGSGHHLQVLDCVVERVPVAVVDQHPPGYGTVGAIPDQVSPERPLVGVGNLDERTRRGTTLRSLPDRYRPDAGPKFWARAGLELAVRGEVNALLVFVPRDNPLAEPGRCGALPIAENLLGPHLGRGPGERFPTCRALGLRPVPPARCVAIEARRSLHPVGLDHELFSTSCTFDFYHATTLTPNNGNCNGCGPSIVARLQGMGLEPKLLEEAT